MHRLLFVDDHPIYAEGLRRAVSAQMPDLRIETASGLAAGVARLEADPSIDLCLSDQRLGDGEGAHLVELARERFPLVAIGILTAEVTSPLVRRVSAAGAVACLSKKRTVNALAEAIQILFEGDRIFDEAPDGGGDPITHRRREIMRMAAEGLLDKQIGANLEITESTVRNHWQHIFDRLGAVNRTAAVSKAIRLGII